MRLFKFILAFFLFNTLIAQEPNFSISYEEIEIAELGGLQSFAFGKHDGKWLLIGGRLDGLHRRQPWATFDEAGHNTSLIVVDPVNLLKWTTTLNSLPVALREQLSSTNMEFYQENDYLYCIGGYGYSPTYGDHTTYNKLCVIDVPKVIDAIIGGKEISMYFRQIEDPLFQVTGGKLKKINDIYYLLGGQKFIGRYNPMGPDHGPGFIQEYTNEIRKFSLHADSAEIYFEHIVSLHDSVNLHRRDYNAEVQIMPDGHEGITMFSGVFQSSADLPYLDVVNIDSSGYEVPEDFKQYFNHYHCPTIPLYSANENKMHTLFFGGIAQFYLKNGIKTEDINVPFVKTITCITRDSTGNLSENVMSAELPEYIGAGAEFIPADDITLFENHVIDLDKFDDSQKFLGYIYGGINSPEQNIFFINDGTQSYAENRIFKVYLNKNSTSASDTEYKVTYENLNLEVYPNPTSSQINISFFNTNREKPKLSLYSSDGKLIEIKILKSVEAGNNNISFNFEEELKPGIYFISIENSVSRATKKFIIK